MELGSEVNNKTINISLLRSCRYDISFDGQQVLKPIE